MEAVHAGINGQQRGRGNQMLQILIVLVVSAHAWRPDHSPTSREYLTPAETNVHHLIVPGNIPSEHRSYWGFGAAPSASVGPAWRRETHGHAHGAWLYVCGPLHMNSCMSNLPGPSGFHVE